jgi:site-specific recombinase XerD
VSLLGSAEAIGVQGQPTALHYSRLDHLVQQVARLYRKAHITAEDWRYVNKRVRHTLGLRGRPTRAKRLPDILTPEELRQILEQAYRDRGLYGLIVRTLFETGLRVSELVAAQVPDVDLSERTLRVRAGKGGKDRLVLFTADLAQQLREYLGNRIRGALFESNRAAAFSARRIQQIVKAVALRAGVHKHIHPHSYRHSMATFLRNQGVALDIVQLLLGHEDPRTTQLYARLSLGAAREEYDRAMASLARQQTGLLDHVTHTPRDEGAPEGLQARDFTGETSR